LLDAPEVHANPTPMQGPLTAPRSPSGASRARSRALRSLARWAAPQSVLMVRGDRNRARRRVALTFDDGPDAMTPRYLEVLEGLGVRATFFVVGENAARAPELVAACARRGHEVGGHGWSHEPFGSMTAAQLAEELSRTQELLPSPVRGRPLVRPPRGELSARTLFRIAAAGYTTVLWSVDSDDCRTAEPEQVARRLAPEALTPGDIVLLHEMQEWTLEALPLVVRALRREGWELATVTELTQGD
jgi:peptidoglycan/xylan/chitin deacetylase (PgdA/CDA1 family)